MSVQLINIVADENILGLDDFFTNNEHVQFYIKKLPGRSLKSLDIKKCDVLLVRSVTQVNQDLLQGSRVRFVGTATSGVEHIDEDYLRTNNIAFAHAKGANANAVAEYIIACIASLSLRDSQNYFEKNIAIVGHGFVGKALEKKLKAFSSSIKVFDPFLSEELNTEDRCNRYCEWEEVMASELISFHVPYTSSGNFPTENLLNKHFFDEISPNSILLNAARGEICNEDGLLKKLTESHIKVVLDVWNNEPDISEKLLSKVDIASPHIAGYSLDAKLNATEILANQVYKYLNISPFGFANNSIKEIALNYSKAVVDYADILQLILLAYDPFYDTERLRAKGSNDLKAHFDSLRKNYTHRLEWNHYDLSSLEMTDDAKNILRDLDFKVDAPSL